MIETLASSSSSPRGVAVRDKIRENAKLLRLWTERLRSGGDVDHVVDTVQEYASIFEAKTGRSLREASIFEIGFGARPLRMMAMHGLGLNAAGVDLERPVLGGGPGEIIRVLRTNGVERALKSALRSIAFDRREYRALATRMARLNSRPRLIPERLIVGDASRLDLPVGSFDLIVSEDVFEHVRPEALEQLVEKMAKWLKPHGLALIRPFVYTGISGNHLVDWYPYRVAAGKVPSRTEPWEHLRKRRASANTYLNQFSRANYRELFETRFRVEEERVRYPDLGRKLLTRRLASELAAWPEEELFSNSIQFILRPKSES